MSAQDIKEAKTDYGDNADVSDLSTSSVDVAPKSKFSLISDITDKLATMTKEDISIIYDSIETPDDEEPAETISDTSSITKVTRGEIDVKEDLTAIFSGSDLTEEFKAKVTDIFETALVTKINQKLAQIAEQTESEISEAVVIVKEELNEKLDAYLDYVVDKWLEDNKLEVEAGIKVEMTESFMRGLKDLFTEHYVEIPEGGDDIIDSLANEVDELETKLSGEIEANVQLKKQIGAFEKQSIFDEVVSGLTDVQVSKLESLAEAVVFDDATAYRESIRTIRESYFSPKTVAAGNSAKSLDDSPVEDNEDTSVENDPSMKAYVEAISRSLKK